MCISLGDLDRCQPTASQTACRLVHDHRRREPNDPAQVLGDVFLATGAENDRLLGKCDVLRGDEGPRPNLGVCHHLI